MNFPKNSQKGFTRTLKRRSLVSGFTLVEMLVSVVIFSLSILSMLVILGGGLKDVNYAKNKITATYLAQEGIEYIRNLRDDYVLYNASTGEDWGSFVTNGIAPCTTSPCGFHDTSANLADPIGTSPVFDCSDVSDCDLYVENTKYNSEGLGDNSGFNRQINIKPVSADRILVISNVYWQQGSSINNVSFSEYLFKWY